MPDKETSQRSIWFFNSSAHMRLFTCSNFLSPARMLSSEWHWTVPDQIIVWYWTATVHIRPDRSFSK